MEAVTKGALPKNPLSKKKSEPSPLGGKEAGL